MLNLLFVHLPAYLPTYISIYLPTYLPTYAFTNTMDTNGQKNLSNAFLAIIMIIFHRDEL